MLTVKNLTKTYNGAKRSLEMVSFTVRPGEMTAIIGPSGAGKTTILRSINQLIPDDSGEIFLDDQDIRQLNKQGLRRVRHRIGMIFQNYNLVDQLTAIENVLHGRLGAKLALAGMLSLYSREEKQEALDLLAEMGLADFAISAAATYPGDKNNGWGSPGP
ncbi:phosphonate ABC transporter ATP-binding protein [Agrilactobacillus composti DSM 18527 = JCM 14202]|nr:phosphonate ABC transporter ATP-binding protein [Agrilactobacillus composti DSM 18527 = JCM 14202]